MSDAVQIALISGFCGIAVAAINAAFLQRPMAKVLRKLTGIEEHLGIETDDNGKVVVLRASQAQRLEYQDEVSK